MGICCNILQIVVTKLKSGFGKEKAMLAKKLVAFNIGRKFLQTISFTSVNMLRINRNKKSNIWLSSSFCCVRNSYIIFKRLGCFKNFVTSLHPLTCFSYAPGGRDPLKL
jgi:hypothetical protein